MVGIIVGIVLKGEVIMFNSIDAAMIPGYIGLTLTLYMCNLFCFWFIRDEIIKHLPHFVRVPMYLMALVSTIFPGATLALLLAIIIVYSIMRIPAVLLCAVRNIREDIKQFEKES